MQYDAPSRTNKNAASLCLLSGVPSGARSRNLLFHRQALCRLSYRHHVEEGGRVSRVLFLMVISLGPFRDRPRRRLRDGSRLPASASNLQAADSEIAAGRIALFTPAVAHRPGLCCSHAANRAPIWTVDTRLPGYLPGFHRAPTLCAARTFLWRRDASDHPCPPFLKFSRCRTSLETDPIRRGQRMGWIRCLRRSAVPKGRFELPRGYPHYALNVARLPVPPLRLAACGGLSRPAGPEPTSGLEPETCCLRNSCSTN